MTHGLERLHVGDRVHSSREGWSGTLVDLIYGDDQDVPGAAVIQLDEPIISNGFLTLDLSDVTIVPWLIN